MNADDSSTEWVTFRHFFILPGFDRPHRPGSFEIRTDRERLDVSWPAYRLIVTILLTNGAELQACEVKRDDLDEALRRDNAEGSPQPDIRTLEVRGV